MTRDDAAGLAFEMVARVRAAANPASVAQAAVLPLEVPALFAEDEIRQVASFLYLTKKRTRASDADFVADQLLVLLRRLQPGAETSPAATDGRASAAEPERPGRSDPMSSKPDAFPGSASRA